MVGARMVRTVEELRALDPNTAVRREGRRPDTAGRLLWLIENDGIANGGPGLPATVLAPAVDPDDKALVEKVALAAKEAWLTVPHTRGGTRGLWLGIARAALKAVPQ